MAINYDRGRPQIWEAVRVLHDARPEDIISFETVLSPHSFDREVRVILRLPYEREIDQREMQRRDMERIRAEYDNMRSMRVQPRFTTNIDTSDDEDDEDENRLRRLGVK